MAGKKLVLQVGVDVGNGVQNLADLKAVLDAIAKGTGSVNLVFGQLSKVLNLSLAATKEFADNLGLSYEQIAKAVVELKDLQTGGADTAAQFDALSNSLGLSRDQFDILAGTLANAAQASQQAAKATQQAGQSFNAVGGDADAAAQQLAEFVRLAKTLGTDVPGAQQLASDLNLTAGQINVAIARLRELQAANVSTGRQFQALSDDLGLTADQFAKLSAAAAKAARVEEQTNNLTKSQSAFGGGLGELAFKFNNVVGAAQTLIGTLKPAYDLLIASNERLNQELLRSAGTLASTNRVFQGGIEITDPSKQIQALQGPLRASLQQLQKDTQSLVGVTSQQVNTAFSAVISNVGQLNNQSAQFKNGLEAATALTPKLVAGIGAIGLPLDQISQEIRSILQGQISSDSQLAKSLGITNQQVNDWRAQGVLVDQLNARLESFVAANKAASQSIGGYSSNIQDIIEVVSRNAGAPLFEIVVEQLGKIYEFLQQNQDAIQSFTSSAIAGLADLLENLLTALGDRLSEVLPALIELGQAGAKGGKLVVDGLTAAVEVADNLAPSLAPVLESLGKIAGVAIQIIETSQEGIALLSGGVGRNTEALDAYAQATQQLGEEGIKANTDLKAAIDARNAAQQNGTALTQDQLQAETAAAQRVQGSIDALKKQRQELESFIAIGPEAKRNRDEQVASIDRQIAASEKFLGALQKSGGGVTTQARELQELGGTYEQLSNQVENAQRNINTATSQQQADDSAKQLIELTQQQLSLGRITSDEAVKRFQEISTNTKLGFQVQSEANKALTQIQQTEGDRRVQAVQAEQNEVKRLQAEGKLTDAQAEQQLTQLKVKELQTRLENIRAFLKEEEDAGRGNGERAIALRQQEADIIASIAETQAEAEKKALEERLKEIERTGKEAIAAATLAETQRQTDIQKLINDGVISEEEANKEKLDSTKERIQAELAAEQQKLNQLRALPSPTDPDERRNLEEQIRDQIQKTAQLQLNLLENERQQQLAVQQAAQQAIRDRLAIQQQASQKAIAALTSEKAAQDAIANSIQRQSNLLQARQGLQQAISEYQNTVGQQETDRLQQALALRQRIAETEDAGVKRVLQAQLQRLGVYGNEAAIANQLVQQEEARAAAASIQQEVQFNFARQSNELEIQRNKIAAERAVTEAKIAELKAQQEALSARSAVEEAQQIVDPAERERAVRAAQAQADITAQQVELSSQAVTEAQAQADAQEQIANYSRQTLNYQQATARAQTQTTNESRRNAVELQRAEVSSRRVRQNLNSVSSNIGFGSGSSASFGGGSSLSLPGFKDGGVAGPGPAVVGERGPELVNFGSPSRVWSNEDSQKIASQLLNSSLVPVGAGISMNAIAPASAPIAGNNIQLLKAIETLNQNLSTMGSGITVQNLQHSATYQVPKDLTAVSELVNKAQIDMINRLRSSLGGY